MSTAEARPRRTALIVVLIVGLVMLLFLACAGGIGAIAYLGFRSGGEEASTLVDDLFRSIDAGNDETYYHRQTSDGFRANVTLEAYEQLCNVFRARLGKLEGHKQESLMLRQNNLDQFIEAKYAATFAKGEGTVDVIWQRQSGEPWRLHNLVVKSPLLVGALAGHPCPHCGELAPTDARFCPHCGEEIPAGAAEKEEVAEQPPAPTGSAATPDENNE
ncbi:MAG: zinc-ribbon domain-containing protein [Pirellulales bacterium]